MAEFVTKALAKHHDRGAFRCGVEELDSYLRQQAGQDIKRRAAAVFVMCPTVEAGKIAGYYTLCSASVKLSVIPESRRKRLARYPDVPAILIGRLARDVGFPGIGAKLLADAFARSLRVADEIAATVVLVDAKNERARKFYKAFGFETVQNSAKRMYIPLKTVSDAIGRG